MTTNEDIEKDSILITGGMGVIGSYIANRLVDLGHHVVVLDAGEAPRNLWIAENTLGEGITLVKARMEKSRDFLMEAARKCKLVIHAAASTGIPHSTEHPDDDWISNVEATRTLLEAYRAVGNAPPTIVFSSVKPYDLSALDIQRDATKHWLSHPDDHGVDEEFLLIPDEPYAASKMAQSALCLAYAQSYGMPIVTLRFSNLCGPAPCHGPRHGWLTWFCISAAIGRPIQIQGDGRQTRDMLYASDVYAAVLAAYKNIEDCRADLFNVGGGLHHTISVREAAMYLHEISDVPITHGPSRQNEDPLFITNHDKFTDATRGWLPTVHPKTAIENIYTWALERKEELRRLYETNL